MTDGNGQDRQAQRLALTRRLMQLAPKARIDAMIEGADAKSLVRSLPPQDLYMTIVDVGLADASEIVQLSSPEQFRTYVDLASWKRDRIDPREVLVWLRAARGDDPQDFLKKLHSLDMEVLEYLFRTLIRVHDLEEHPDVNPPGVTMESPEGKYLLEFMVEGAELAALRAVVNDLIAEDPFKAGRLFEALRWEVPTELEEAAYRFRSARLSDLGFPELYQALALYAYTDPDKLAPKAVSPVASEQLATAGQRIDYVEAAFRGLVATEQDNLEDEVRYLVNSALVADGAEPGDPLAVRRSSEMARDYLQLGLEHLCGGDPMRAPEVVQEHHLNRVFQVGFSLTLRLKFRVDRMAKEPGARLDDTWLLLPDVAPAVKALHRRRPLRALKVEGAEPVPFRTRREIAQSEMLLDRASLQREVFSTVLGSEPRSVMGRFGVPISALLPERLFAAVLSHALLDGRVHAAPVPEDRLVELCERWIAGEGGEGQLRQAGVDKVVETIADRVPPAAHDELRRMVQWTMNWVAEEIGKPYLAEGRLEPKVVTRLPIAGQALV